MMSSHLKYLFLETGFILYVPLDAPPSTLPIAILSVTPPPISYVATSHKSLLNIILINTFVIEIRLISVLYTLLMMFISTPPSVSDPPRRSTENINILYNTYATQ